MKSEKMRNSEKVKKPLLPSRIPKKGDRSPSRNKQPGKRELKRPFTTVTNKVDDATERPQFENETRDAHRLLLTAAPQTETTSSTVDTVQPPLSPTQELVKLIPTLSGIDVSNLVASIKRRRVQRAKRQTAGENSTRQQRSEVIKRTTRPLLPPGPNALTDQNKEQKPTAALPVLGGGATHHDLPRTAAVSLLSEELKAMPTETPKEVCKLPSRSLADELSRQANRLNPTHMIFQHFHILALLQIFHQYLFFRFPFIRVSAANIFHGSWLNPYFSDP